jgi:hypothetical protein
MKLRVVAVLALRPAFFAYAAASLFHHAHNAQLLDQYPNMPAWLTPLGVYAAWLATTAIGLVGYLRLRGGSRRAGVTLLAIYGLLGFFGLAHYVVAPVSAHTPMMHLSIGLEAVTAVILLVALFRHHRRP